MEHGAWEALRAISQDPRITARRPNAGCTVRVIEGKRLGMVGRVTWHGINRFNRAAFRYGDDMTGHLRDLHGQHGYRVRVQPEDGSAPFFIAAEKVCVL